MVMHLITPTDLVHTEHNNRNLITSTFCICIKGNIEKKKPQKVERAQEKQEKRSVGDTSSTYLILIY